MKKLKPRLVPTIRAWVSLKSPVSSAAMAAAAATHRPAINARTMTPVIVTELQSKRGSQAASRLVCGAG